MKSIFLTVLLLVTSLTYGQTIVSQSDDKKFSIYADQDDRLFLKFNNGGYLDERLDIISATSESAPTRFRAIDARFLSNSQIIVRYEYQLSFDGNSLIYNISLGDKPPYISLKIFKYVFD